MGIVGEFHNENGTLYIEQTHGSFYKVTWGVPGCAACNATPICSRVQYTTATKIFKKLKLSLTKKVKPMVIKPLVTLKGRYSGSI